MMTMFFFRLYYANFKASDCLIFASEFVFPATTLRNDKTNPKINLVHKLVANTVINK